MSALLFITAVSGAQSPDANWEKFHQSPRVSMQQIPTKYDKSGKKVRARTDSLFSDQHIDSKSFLKIKFESRQQLEDSTPAKTNTYAGVSSIRARLSNFLDLREFQDKNISPVFSLKEIETQNLLSATLEKVPWSDTYWPLYKGGLGARYSSDNFEAVGVEWQAYHSAVQGQNSLTKVLERNDPIELANLSPSEKYDLLIGRPEKQDSGVEGFLTPQMWNEGKQYWEKSGDVEAWMGLCHGWAPASFMVDAPIRDVTAPSAIEGLNLNFFPSDLKGLLTYSWATSMYDSRMVGGRCNLTEVKTDEATGRILDEECFDVNPAIWHLAIINQIGKAKRSFVLDASFDYEVWNQPLVSYSIEYINPQTAIKYSSFEQAKIKIAQYKKDKFTKWRSPLAKEVVGVKMEVTYVVENRPSHDLTDTEPVIRTVSYDYDLELDAKGDVIGGEWLTQAHPDFLWLPRANAKAFSAGDEGLQNAEWDLKEPLPKFWRDIAIFTAENYGQVVSRISHLLVEKSR